MSQSSRPAPSTLRADTPVREESVHAGLQTKATMSNATPAPRGDVPLLGFTAVNGDHQRHTSFRPDNSAIRSQPVGTVSKSVELGRSSSSTRPPDAAAAGWRPDDRAAVDPVPDRPLLELAESRKRKRADSAGSERRHVRHRSSRSRSVATPSTGNSASPRHFDDRRPGFEAPHDVGRRTASPDLQGRPSPPSRWSESSQQRAQRPEPRPDITAELTQAVRRQFPDLGRSPSDAPPMADGDNHHLSPEEQSPDESAALTHDTANRDVTENGENPEKKRKRVFSNRTKTGCHTCRLRKKKCDEGKPECTNCLRGGFACGGYGPKPPPGNKVPPRNSMVPLQSKQPYEPSHGPTGYYDGFNMSPTRQFNQWPERPPLPEANSRIPPHYPPGPPPLPPVQAPPPGPPSAPNPMDTRPSPSREPWPRPAWAQPGQGPPPYIPEPSSASEYPPMGPHDTHSAQHRGLAEPWGQQPSAASYRPFGPASAGPGLGSRASLSRSSSSQRVHFPLGDMLSEAELKRFKMIAGEPFQYFCDRLLLGDRHSCNHAVVKYNKSLEPGEDVGEEEKTRRFRKILDPKERESMGGWRGPVGKCGSKTIVNSPFNCDYGYNVHLGHEVVIQAGCYLQDAAEIHIGNRVVVGLGVRFLTLNTKSFTLDFKNPKPTGISSFVTAGAIVVEDDCTICAGAIITPFRTIGKGAIVAEGAVVTSDVKPYTFVEGNPAKFVRRIEEGAHAAKHHDPDIQEQNEKMLHSMSQRRKNLEQDLTTPLHHGFHSHGYP